jgi:hypothetical protein
MTSDDIEYRLDPSYRGNEAAFARLGTALIRPSGVATGPQDHLTRNASTVEVRR